MIKRDEKCTCTCGGQDSEDHTVNNGCEQRGCTCTWWPVLFENTRTQIVKWYSVTGAPYFKSRLNIDNTEIDPVAVKFIFYEGEECIEMTVSARVIRRNGERGDRVVRAGLFIWNRQEWPQWLHELYALACSEARIKVPA